MHTQTSNLECKQSVPPILRMYNGKYHCAYIMKQKKISYVCQANSVQTYAACVGQ